MNASNYFSRMLNMMVSSTVNQLFYRYLNPARWFNRRKKNVVNKVQKQV